MSFWNDFTAWLSGSTTDSASGMNDMSGLDSQGACEINPASGLPMVGGCGGLDVEGNPYGIDPHDDLAQASGFDESTFAHPASDWSDTWASDGSDFSSWDH